MGKQDHSSKSERKKRREGLTAPGGGGGAARVLQAPERTFQRRWHSDDKKEPWQPRENMPERKNKGHHLEAERHCVPLRASWRPGERAFGIRPHARCDQVGM
jgi:hypothetical protein